MAIFHMVDDPDMIDEEYEYEYEDNDILDDMLETCYAMIDDLSESTAAQRHYGVTTKDIKNYYNRDSIGNYTKSDAKRNAYNIGVDNAHGGGSRSAYRHEPNPIHKKAIDRGETGYEMQHLAKTGVNVKKYYDEGKRLANRYFSKKNYERRKNRDENKLNKEINDHDATYIRSRPGFTGKKKAVKEACYTILDMLDEI